MQRVTELDDPERCTAASLDGQCRNRAEHGSDRCRAHGGKNTEEAESKRLYYLAKAKDRERLVRLSEHENIKSLRDEISITRMLIEDIYNSCTSETDLLSRVGTLNQLMMTSEKLIKTAHSIEQSLHNLLAKPTLLSLAHDLSTAIHEELADVENHEAIVDRICQRLITSIANAGTTVAK